ncbi:hypothetical protein PT2222_80080 [Paraburkholderia tropica]
MINSNRIINELIQSNAALDGRVVLFTL